MTSRKIIIITAPSGAGKTSIVTGLLGMIPGLRFGISATTRKPRPSETHGKDYLFVTTKEFRRMIQADEFAEYEEVYPGAFYGTPRSELEPATRTEPVILDLDVKGAKRLSEAFGEDCLTIFVRPPSLAALEDRLRDRGTESTRSLQARMKRAREEMRYRNTFNVDVINHSLPDSVQATALVVMAYLMT